MSPVLIYKAFTQADWDAFQAGQPWPGSSVDVRDGFVHFSAAGQIKSTLDRHFAGEAEVVVAAFDAAAFGAALVWEPSRDGALFPHLYSALPRAALLRHWRLSAPFALPTDVTP